MNTIFEIVNYDNTPGVIISQRKTEARKAGVTVILYTRKSVPTKTSILYDCKLVESDAGLIKSIKDDDVVIINSTSQMTDDHFLLMSDPEDGIVTCLSGARFSSVANGKIKQLCPCVEYNRLRNSKRFSEGDSGMKVVHIPTRNTPMSMRGSVFKKLVVTGGDDVLFNENELAVAAAINDIQIAVVDPELAGIKWSILKDKGKIGKKNIQLVGGENRCLLKYSNWKPIDGVEYKEAIKQLQVPVVEESSNKTLPEVLPIVFCTHDRTAVACYCLYHLAKNLRYENKIKWIISDDRSVDGHVDALVRTIKEAGVPGTDVVVFKADNERFGLGASLNSGLSYGYELSDVVLTVEDDWLLHDKFDITRFVATAMSGDVAGVRMGGLTTKYCSLLPSNHYGFSTVTGNNNVPKKNHYVYNLQCMLRHRMVFDALGMFPENCSTNTVEETMKDLFNDKTLSGNNRSMQVLWPNELRVNSLCAGIFEHIGRTTVGHNKYVVPSRWSYMNEDDADERILSIDRSSMISADDIFTKPEIVYVTDGGGIDLMLVSIFSLNLVCRSAGRNANVTILTERDNTKLRKIAGILSTENLNITVRKLPDKLLTQCDVFNLMTNRLKKASATSIALSKFELCNLLPEHDRILFLDCDTLVMGDPLPLFDLDIPDGAYAGVVSDIGFVSMKHAEGPFKPRSERSYFNSGMMVLDLESMRRDHVSKKLWEAKLNVPDQTLTDQNAFNDVFRNAVHLPPKYNFLALEIDRLENKMGLQKTVEAMNDLYGTEYLSISGSESSMLSDAVIMHYAGIGKPWGSNPNPSFSRQWYTMNTKTLEFLSNS